jgi:hypothetical protein
LTYILLLCTQAFQIYNNNNSIHIFSEQGAVFHVNKKPQNLYRNELISCMFTLFLLNLCKILYVLLSCCLDHENEEDLSGGWSGLSDDQMSTVVDQVLDHDGNGDGYISFGEFRQAQASVAHEEERKAKKCTTCGD